jgi:hypothetical protein
MPSEKIMNTTDMYGHWRPLKKIAFRFFFIFFILEVFVMDFIVIWSGFNSSVLNWMETLTPPFLWLNNHIFHFHYRPVPGWTFTYSLDLVRNITYAGVALVGCLVWTILDRRNYNYNRLDFWFREILCIGLAGVMWAYGIIKVIPSQMSLPDSFELYNPIGNLHPFTLLWRTLGYGTPYKIFTGIGEILGAVLILPRRTRPIGLLILVTILLNIVILNYTFIISTVTLYFSFVLLLITLYLLIPYLRNLWRYFFTDQLVNQFIGQPPRYAFTTRWKKLAVMTFGVLMLGTTVCISSFKYAIPKYAEISTIRQSREYSEVKNFVLNGDTLNNLIVGDTIRWRFWTEQTFNNKTTVTLHKMNSYASERYSLTADSLNRTLTLKPNDRSNAGPIVLTYQDRGKRNWRLQGEMNGKQITADLQRVDPDTMLVLLRAKRKILLTDPEEF